MPTLTSPNRLITDWLTEQSEIIPIEKSIDGKVTINDIQGTLREYQGLFKAGYASPAMILTLYRAYPDSALYKEVVEERGLLKEDPMVVGGPASVEMIDHEGHLITAAALSKAYDKYMENPMTRNVMVMHSDIQVGWALPAYISRSGEVFKGGMNDKTLFFISELRKDTKISKKVTEQITKSKMRSYSIAGSAIKTANVAGNLLKGESPYMRVDELELAEVTICEKGVNQGAGFDLIKSHNHATKSCADGSCLITKSPDVKPLQNTETMTFADYKDLLNNDNKDTKSFVQMFKEYVDIQKATKEQQDAGLKAQSPNVSESVDKLDQKSRSKLDSGRMRKVRRSERATTNELKAKAKKWDAEATREDRLGAIQDRNHDKKIKSILSGAGITGTPSGYSSNQGKPEKTKSSSPQEKKAASNKPENEVRQKRMGLGGKVSTQYAIDARPDVDNPRQMGFHKMMLLLRLAKARRNGFRLNSLRSTQI